MNPRTVAHGLSPGEFSFFRGNVQDFAAIAASGPSVGLRRVQGQTTLPDSRVRAVFSVALQEACQRPECAQLAPMQRAVMIAAAELWAEEKLKKDPNQPPSLTGSSPPHMWRPR